MKRMMLVALAGAAMSLANTLTPGPVSGQPFNDKPLTELWWPSEFGPGDKAGGINRITPEIVVNAIKLIKRGSPGNLVAIW